MKFKINLNILKLLLISIIVDLVYILIIYPLSRKWIDPIFTMNNIISKGYSGNEYFAILGVIFIVFLALVSFLVYLIDSQEDKKVKLKRCFLFFIMNIGVLLAIGLLFFITFAISYGRMVNLATRFG